VPDTRPIGLFDSGVGGLTVVSEIFRMMPREAIIYFADTARFPYGGRPHSEISQVAAGIAGYLVEQAAKAIIVACNTSTAVALPLLRELFPVPIVGVISPGAKVARNKQVGVIATEGTVRSRSYEVELHREGTGITVYQQACPLLTQLVELGCLQGGETDRVLRSYLAPLQAQRIDTLILGCTHYPYLRAGIGAILGPAVALVDPAAETVREMKAILQERGMLRRRISPPRHRFIASKDPEHLRAVGSRLLGQAIARVELVPPDRLPVLGE
jgi:glutamate racemase